MDKEALCVANLVEDFGWEGDGVLVLPCPGAEIVPILGVASLAHSESLRGADRRHANLHASTAEIADESVMALEGLLRQLEAVICTGRSIMVATGNLQNMTWAPH